MGIIKLGNNNTDDTDDNDDIVNDHNCKLQL